jgi:putative inorganic carbon (HCO3(-)) transporter
MIGSIRIGRSRGIKRISEHSLEVQARAISRLWPREWIYFIIVMAGWCFTPLLRRLIDWHNGFYSTIPITSLVPFLLTLGFAFICFRPERLARISMAFKALAWVWFGSLVYGVVVGVFSGNIFASVYEAIQFAVPMLVGVWVAGLDLDHRVLMRRLTVVALILSAIVAAYGLVQWVNPPPWDILWLQGGNFDSMGTPVPFGLRIFSTLNSTGPAAEFFALTFIFTLPYCAIKKVWIWPFLALLGAALLLTLVREAWIALFLGVIVYLVASPRRFRTLPFLVLYCGLLMFLVASLPALLGAQGNSDVLTERLATLNDVSHDGSAIGRTSEIEDAIEASLSNPLGTGLGTIGSASALSSNPSSPQGNVLDSGYMSRLVELGWLGFVGYLIVSLGGLLLIIKALMTRTPRSELFESSKVIIATAAAICAALVWADAAGDTHLGLDGVFFWISLALGLREYQTLVDVSSTSARPNNHSAETSMQYASIR